jgi:hypothetical protein
MVRMKEYLEVSSLKSFEALSDVLRHGRHSDTNCHRNSQDISPPIDVLVLNTLDSHARATNSSTGPDSCISFTSPKSVHPILQTLHTIRVNVEKVTITQFTFIDTI